MNRLRSALVAVVATIAFVALAISIAPGVASGHAQLTGSVPERGAALNGTPKEVVLRFNEPVEGSFGGIAIFDSTGRKLETGPVTRPGDRADELSVTLEEELDDGAYTVTYRVVSADSHPIAGGFIFSVGESAAPAMTVAELLRREQGADETVDIVFAAAKVATYIALAQILGGLVFAFCVWLPVGGGARGPEGWSRDFAAVIRRLVGWGGGTLVLAALVSLVAQGARAAGSDLFAALDPDVLRDVADTRFGHTALVRIAVGLLIAATSLGLFRTGAGGRLAAALVAAAGLTASTSLGLGGHAGTSDTAWLTVASNLVHVLAMATWFGGLGLLLYAYVGMAPGRGDGADTSLLAALVARFSTIAMVAVAALIVTGILQSVVYLEAPAELWQTAFGRAILVKVALLFGLIGLGFYNRQILLPRLRTAAAGSEPPGGTGLALKTALRLEIALAVGVLVASAALSSYAPLASTDAVYSETASAGPIEAELVLEPPRVGAQALHLYLFDGVTGRQWSEVEEIELTAEERDKEIGPLPIELRNAGPGHYVAGGSLIAVPGEWTLTAAIRASEFDVYKASFEVRVR